MISKYLIELIKNNNRIIIPDLGAFMIQDSPNGKQISFNDFLKFNDGLLINQIIKTDKVGKDEAADKIKNFIKDVEKSFQKGESYKIENLGFLTRDSHNNIKFSKEGIGNTEASVKPKTKETVEDKAKITIPPQPEKPKQEEVKKVEPVKKEVAKEQEKKPEVVLGNKRPEIKTQQKATERKPIPNTNKPNTNKSKPTNQIQEDESNSVVVNIIIVVMILGFLIWLAIHFDLFSKFKKDKTVKREVVEVVEPAIESTENDAIVDDEENATTVKEEPIVEEPTIEEAPVVKEEEPAVVNDNRTKYYLIAGSFKVESNAKGFNQKLINEGFEDSEIIPRNNGFNCVSFKYFYTWEDVAAEWKQMKSEHPEVWILKQ